MAIRDIKHWQWIAISVVVGGVLAAVHLFNRPGHTDTTGNVISPGMFAAKVSRLVGREKQPALRHVVIHPPMRSASPGDSRVQLVTGEIFDRIGGGKSAYKPFHLYSPIPFVTDDAQTQARGPDFSIRHFLDEGAVPGTGTSYTYAWWLSAPVIVASRLGLSVLVIGVLWPPLLSLLIGAGWGGGSAEADTTYDLNRFATDPEPTEVAATVVGDDGLRDFNNSLAQTLHQAFDTPTCAPKATPPSTVELSSPPLDVAASELRTEKTYHGDYYPVEDIESSKGAESR